MKEIVKLAWRNLWRNKRRTLITTASVFFAVLIALLMRSFQIGTYDHMIHNVVETYSGYIQIQNTDYWAERSTDNTFSYTDAILQHINETDNVVLAVPRLESFGLAAADEQTKVAIILGIDPQAENELSQPANRLVDIKLTPEALENLENENLPESIMKKLKELENNSYSGTLRLELDFGLESNALVKYLPTIKKCAAFKGSYFADSNDQSVLVADRLAKYLNISVNDTIVIMSQGYHGASATGKYPVRGIVKIPSPQLDNSLIYMPLKVAQTLYGVENRLTSIALNVKNKSDKALATTIEEINSKLQIGKITTNTDSLNNTFSDVPLSVKDWKSMNKELVQQIEGDSQSGAVMLAVLYLVIAFGIFGTILMLTAERKREFGVMVAIGMQKYKLSRIVALEIIFMGILGSAGAMLASTPIIIYFYFNPVQLTGDFAKSVIDMGFDPVMPFAWFDTYFVNQALIVLVIVIIAVIFPTISIRKLQVTKALRA